jgi:hypothetical protein
MAGSGGTSAVVSVQPAVRMRRTSKLVRKIYCRIIMERLLWDLVVKTMGQWTRKTIGSGLQDYSFSLLTNK